MDRWVDYIEWYDPQGRHVGAKCLQPSNIHTYKLKLSCLMVLTNLTLENFGSYTCQAGNGYAKHCTRSSFEIRIPGKQTRLIRILHKNRHPVFFNTKVDAVFRCDRRLFCFVLFCFFVLLCFVFFVLFCFLFCFVLFCFGLVFLVSCLIKEKGAPNNQHLRNSWNLWTRNSNMYFIAKGNSAKLLPVTIG